MTGTRPRPLPVQPDDKSDGYGGDGYVRADNPSISGPGDADTAPIPREPALLGPAEVRALAERLGVRPTKQLGQNFVIDPNTIRRIVRAAGLRPDDTVVEVGPGLGSLTLGLLGAARRVVAVEIDPVLAAALPGTIAERFPEAATDIDADPDGNTGTDTDTTSAPRFTLVQADALRITSAQLPGPPPTALVANLPYNVAVPVLLHMLEQFPSLERVLIMVQAEVADRLAAEPGGRVYGVPSVKARWYASVRRAGSIGKNVFWPAPHVESGLVALERREPPTTLASRKEVFAVVDAAFAQRRKTLRAALSGWAGSAARAEEILRRAGVDPAARGEALAVDQYAAIAEAANAGAPGAGPRPAPGPEPEPGPTPEPEQEQEPTP
jgi:16S rRNA (adenine1518-N6/adenine1519-N6)-dimethyltransferase